MKEADIDALATTTAEYAASSGCAVWGVVNNAGALYTYAEFCL
jgi:hypothetical protein